jgi:hypothetical protein
MTVTARQDIHAYDPTSLAVLTSDTLEHDMSCIPGTRVAVHNMCTDTTRHMNGIVANMHPSEGVWLFRGAQRNTSYGGMFGDHGVCGAFPTSAPQVKRQQSITVQDAHTVVRMHSQPVKKAQYMCFDEAYFKTLESMQWNRDNGYIELVPIIVGLP